MELLTNCILSVKQALLDNKESLKDEGYKTIPSSPLSKAGLSEQDIRDLRRTFSDHYPTTRISENFFYSSPSNVLKDIRCTKRLCDEISILNEKLKSNNSN